MPRALPRLIVNLKNYPEAAAKGAVALAKAAARTERALGVPVAVAPTALDVRACVEAGARVYAQHFDRVEQPASTGWLSPQLLRQAGCEGSLINHSEHRLGPEDIAWNVETARKARLVSVLCTKDAEESRRLASLRPHMVAVEPPELIGGDVSVTSANPEVVRRSVDAVRGVSPRSRVLCGAGVKTGEDVAAAVRLGAYGILVASGITKAKDPPKALRALADGLR